MGLQSLTTPASPVSLIQVKAALRIVNDLVDGDNNPYSSDDAALSLILPAAVEHIQNETRQQFCTRQYLFTADGFPNEPHWPAGADYNYPAREAFTFDRIHFDRFIKLPKPPLQSVQSLQYLDTTGTLQTLDPSAYTVDVTSRPGRIALNPGSSWPQTNRAANCLQITFTAGYGDATAVPTILQQAITLLAGSWYAQRENDITLRINSIPIGVQAIIAANMFPTCEG